LRPKSAKSREIPRKFELIAVHGHPMSSALVQIENVYATSYLTLKVTLDIQDGPKSDNPVLILR